MNRVSWTHPEGHQGPSHTPRNARGVWGGHPATPLFRYLCARPPGPLGSGGNGRRHVEPVPSVAHKVGLPSKRLRILLNVGVGERGMVEIELNLSRGVK